ncbi:MAG: hypothetical protein FJ304_19280 [Planctomycetes bacterium]|nr:hypothetical protein [Planctomycetota bacterium]
MLYFSITMCCPYCPDRPFTCRLAVEVEPPPDTIFLPRCPYDAMPLRVRFSEFKPCEPFPPDAPALRYQELPPPPKPRWWQFWKRP